ncbi:MAG: hypothetical protein ABFC38_00680 [Methanospirillum sp.]
MGTGRCRIGNRGYQGFGECPGQDCGGFDAAHLDTHGRGWVRIMDVNETIVVPELAYIHPERFQGRIQVVFVVFLSGKVKEKDIFVSPSTEKRYW